MHWRYAAMPGARIILNTKFISLTAIRETTKIVKFMHESFHMNRKQY